MGVFVCQKCYRHHFEMGTKYCEVKSLSLATEWSFKEVEVLAKTGNKVVNGIYEASMDDDWDNEKEIVTFDKEEEKQARCAFVRKKYLERKYFSEAKYHAVMAKLNPNYEQDRQERQTRRRASLSNSSSVIIPATPRVQRRGSVGNYSTVSPKTPDPKQTVNSEKAKQQNTPPPQKQNQLAVETSTKANSSDLKSQPSSATGATPQDARRLLGLTSTTNLEMHRTPSRSSVLEKTPSRRSMLEKTPSRSSMLENQRSSSVRNMVHGDKASRVSSLLGGGRSDINDSDHEPGIMMLPSALQAGGGGRAGGYGRGHEQQQQQPLGMRKTRSDLNLAEMNNSSRGQRTLLAGGSLALNSSSRNNDHEHLLSTPGRASGRHSLMNKSASSRSMRGERRSMAYTGGSLLKDNRGVAPSPRQSASTRGGRTTDLRDIGFSLLQDSRGNVHSSGSREPSSRGKRSTGLVEAGASLLQDNRSYLSAESSSRGRRTIGDGNTHHQGQRRNSVGRPSRETEISQEERTNKGLPSRVKSSSSKKDALRNSNHGKQSVRGGRSGNYNEATPSDRNGRQHQGSVGSNSSSADSSSDDEFGYEKRNHSGLGRSNSRDSPKNHRSHSRGSLDDPGKSKNYSKQGKAITQRRNSRTKDPRDERPAHVWKKHPSTRDVRRSRSFGDIDESDSDDEKPDHVWKKQDNSKATKKKITRCKSHDSTDESLFPGRRPEPRAAKKKITRCKSHDGADESLFPERRPDPRAMMLKKQKSRRSMRRLPNYDDSKLDGSLKDGSMQEGSMQDSSSGKKSSSRRRTRRSSANNESSSSVGKLGSVRETENGNKESRKDYKNLGLRSSCSTGKLGALMASGLPDDDTLHAYADRKAHKRKVKLAGTSKQGSSKDLNGKYSKGLANIRVQGSTKKRGSMKSRSASTGALGLLAMHADPANKKNNLYSGFDQRVQDALKKKATSKETKESGNETNRSFPMKNFDNDKYKSAMVAQWLVSQSAT